MDALLPGNSEINISDREVGLLDINNSDIVLIQHMNSYSFYKSK